MSQSRIFYIIVGILFYGCGEPTPEGGYRSNGEECEWGFQCSGELCIAEQVGGDFSGWPGGVCTKACTGNDCPGNQICTDLGDGGYCLPDCSRSSTECREGYLCHPQLNVCLPHCIATGCPSGLSCAESGICEADHKVLVPPGAPCEAHNDCMTGYCIAPTLDGKPTGWTDGICSMPCSTDGCDGPFQCVVLDATPVCLPSCTESAQCRDGYLCNPEIGACLPDCRSGWTCGTGYQCGQDGLCTFITADLGAGGEACLADWQCQTGWCLEESDDQGPTGWVGGLCTIPCGPLGQCPPATQCAALSGSAWCLTSCTPGPGSLGSCRPGYVCDPFLSVCLPNCHNDGWDCGVQYQCNMQGICAPGGRRR